MGWDQHRRIAWGAALIVGVGASCQLGGEPPGEDGGRDSGSAAVDGGAPPTTGDWTIEIDGSDTFAPGEWMRLRIGHIRPSEERYLWVGAEGTPILPLTFSEPETPPEDPDADEPTAWVAALPAPILPEGRHRIGVGDSETLRSELVEIEIVHPTPRLEHEEAAAVLHRGLSALVSDMHALGAGDGDPDLARALQEQSPDDMDARWDALAGALQTLADGVAEDWMAIPEADRAAVQSAFDRSGVLPFFEALSAEGPRPDPTWMRIPLVERLRAYSARPAHAALFCADLISYVLKIASTITETVEVATALSGVGLPAAGAALGINLIIATAKMAIDTFLPTDLMEISVHGQDFLFDDAGEPFLFYGRFSPQNSGGAVLRSFEDFVLLLLAEALPGPRTAVRLTAVRERVQAIASFVLMRVPGTIVEQLFQGEPRARSVTVPLAMRLYQVTFGDLVSTFPPMSAFSGVFYLFDFDLVTSLAIADGHPDFADDAELLDVGGRSSVVAIRGVPWPGAAPVETATFDLSAAGFRFGEHGSLFKIPGVTRVRHDIYGVVVQNAPAPGSPPLALYNDAALVVDEVNLVGGGTGTVITSSTTDVRAYQITLRDAAYLGPSDETRAGVVVNGETQHTGLAPTAAFTVPILLRPGSNTVTIVAERGDPITCGPGGTTFCVSVELAQVLNAYPHRAVPLVEGGTFSFTVWTPPRFVE